MIDWLTFLIPFEHSEPINSGQVMSVCPDGELQWSTHKAKPIQGSHDSRIQIKSYGSTPDGFEFIHVTGNPVKFFQGHNLFGTDDISALLYATLDEVLRILSITPSPVELDSIYAGIIPILRVDINQSYTLPSQSHVEAWLRSAENTAHMRHRGQGMMTKGTLYFGKHSRRWSFKFYSKANEIKASGHTLPPALDTPQMHDWASSKLRAELTLRSMTLKDMGLSLLSNWSKNLKLPQLIFNQYIERLHMADSHTIPADVLADLPPRLIGVYQLWILGHDLRATYPRMTFYRYRKQLLEYGIDLAIKQDVTKKESNVIPLKLVLNVQPATVPEWAKNTPLYFEPRKTA